MMNRSALLKLVVLLLLLVHGSDAKMNIIGKQDVKVGEEILILCKAGGEGEITWQKNALDINDEEKVLKIDESTSKLTIKRATIDDEGRYTCLCEFDNGHSDEVEIHVYVYEGPSFGGTKTFHEFLEGTNVIVPCLVTGKPEVDVSWLRNKQQIPSNGGERVHQLADNTLHIENVMRDDAGTYVCQAQIRGRPVSQMLPVSVVVNAPPKVVLKEEVKKVLAGSENNVSLVCLVDGHPKPNITWTLPGNSDPSRHQYNSDSSQLTIHAVARGDYGEYVCTATNKIAEASATIMLHVFEAPEVFVSAEQVSAVSGQQVSVSCNVSGHPQPELHWLNKNNGQTLDSPSGHIRVADGVLVVEEMMPSDGGVYSCMAVSASGNASRDVTIQTSPGPPLYLSVSPGPASVHFSLKIKPTNGGTPITSFVLQWRQAKTELWKEVTMLASDPLAITALMPYTVYTVRLAALNAVGLGQFSEPSTVRTMGIREPDSPVLSSDKMKVKGNSFSVPLEKTDDGGMPLLHFNVRYTPDTDGGEWREMQLPPSANSVSLQDLSFGSDYQLEVTAVNANGSSIPATFNFTIAEQPANSRTMTKGTIVGIVMVIFLVVFLMVDATCCYRNRCGLLMSIGVKLFGQKVPGLKMVDEVAGATNGDMKLKGMSTPRGSLQQGITKEGGELKEVTCDKAPLTKHEKTQPDRDLANANA